MYNYNHSPKKALAVDFVGGKGYKLIPPTKQLYDKLLTFHSEVDGEENAYFSSQLIEIVTEIMNFNTENVHFSIENIKKTFTFRKKIIDYEAMSKIFCAYFDFCSSIVAEYQRPYYPQQNEQKIYYTPITEAEKEVSDYSGLNFKEIEDLPIDTYMLLWRDAFIYALNSSKDGREYLEDAYIYCQTEPDREYLRAKFGNSKEGV